jgi:hypothetical protein
MNFFPILNAIVPLKNEVCDGVRWLQFQSNGTFQAYKDMPDILKDQHGKTFKKMSWNSDNNTITYKEYNGQYFSA